MNTPPPEPKLLPCPFCRGALTIISTLHDKPFMAECTNNYCGNRRNRIDMFKWNTRPTLNAASDDTKLLDQLSQSTETEWQEFIRHGEKETDIREAIRKSMN